MHHGLVVAVAGNGRLVAPIQSSVPLFSVCAALASDTAYFYSQTLLIPRSPGCALFGGEGFVPYLFDLIEMEPA